MNFTADQRSVQANNIIFYFASRIASVEAEFSVSTFLLSKAKSDFKETFTFFNTNQVTDYVSRNSELVHSLCPSSHTSAKIEKRLGFITSKADVFEYNENAEVLGTDGAPNRSKDQGLKRLFIVFNILNVTICFPSKYICSLLVC